TSFSRDWSSDVCSSDLRIRFQDKLGAALQPLPFYGVIYVVHPTNISGVMKSISRKSIKGMIKRLLLRKRVTKSILQAFNLNPRPDRKSDVKGTMVECGR